MYLIGAELTGKTGFVSLALIQRVRKDLQKYYHVLDVWRCPFSCDVMNLIREIARIYMDSRYTIRKPRFSQIGRPKKMVHEKPFIFAGCDDASLHFIAYLKDNNIPASCVFTTDEKTWHMEVNGKCLKNDFFIPTDALIQNIVVVIEQDRLVLEQTRDELLEAIHLCRESPIMGRGAQNVTPFDDRIMAMAMPIWYYENLLRIRPRTP